MFCDQCGAENREQAKFCIKCGANISTNEHSSFANNQVSSVIFKPSRTTKSSNFETIRKASASSKTETQTACFPHQSFKEFPPTCKISEINSSTFDSNFLSDFGKSAGLVVGFIAVATIYGIFKQTGNGSPILMFIVLSIAVSIFQSFIKNQEISQNKKIISGILTTMVNVDCTENLLHFKITTDYVDGKIYEDIMGKSLLSVFTSKSKFVEFKSNEKKQEFCKKLNSKCIFLIEKGFHFEIVTQALEKIAIDSGIKLVNATNPNYLRLVLVENI